MGIQPASLPQHSFCEALVNVAEFLYLLSKCSACLPSVLGPVKNSLFPLL